MVKARQLVLKGLIEGLVLQVIEREPTHGYAILKAIEDALGDAPNKNQVYPLLARLEEDGLIRSEEDTSDQRIKQVYHLTEAGAEHLHEFRTLPLEFKGWLVELFRIPSPELFAQAGVDVGQRLDADGRADADQGDIQRQGRRRGPGPAARRSSQADAWPVPPPDEGWVPVRLSELPKGPPVRAPFAKVSMNRNPGTGAWELSVEHHEPGGYEGADACPLTYLYLAAQRLLFEPPGGGYEGGRRPRNGPGSQGEPAGGGAGSGVRGGAGEFTDDGTEEAADEEHGRLGG